MATLEKLYQSIMSGTQDKNIKFRDLEKLLALLGFQKKENTKILLVEVSKLAKYEIITWWSKEDNCYLAEVPELPGCMADGETLTELMENVQIMIEEWIERAKELGWEIPEPKGRLLYA